MTPHAPSADTRRRPGAAALVALLLVGALALAVAPGVAAADTLERDGSDLVVNVSSVDDPETVTVEVTDPADTGITYEINATDSEGETVRTNVTTPDEGSVNGVDLLNANVTVTAEPAGGDTTTIADGTPVPLHAVAFADDRPAWVGTEGEGDNATDTLYVPLDAAGTVGFPAATADAAVSVDIDVDDSGTADVNGTVRGGGAQLTVDRTELLSEVGDSRETLDLRVLSSAGPVSDDPTIAPELRSQGDGLALWHPLFDPEGTYAVNASTVGEDARYVNTSAETDEGYLELPWRSADEIDIRVWDADRTEYANYTDAYSEPPKINATIADDGSLRFDRSLAGLAVDGAIAGTGADRSTYADVDGEIDDEGGLALNRGESELNATEPLLLSTAAGDVVVMLDPGSGGEGGVLGGLGESLVLFPVFLLPLLVGVAPGVVIGYRNDEDTDLVDTAIVGVLGFALAGLAAIGMLFVFATSPFGTGVTNLVGYVGVLLGTVGTAAGHHLLSGGGGVVASGPFAAKVTVTDGSDLFRGDVTVHYREPDGRDRYDPVTVRGGRETIQLPGTGTWEVYASHGSTRSNVETVDASDPAATLTIPVEATLTVVDAVDGEPVADATIGGAAGVSGTTDRNGAVTLDPPEDATDAEIEVSHDRYADVTERVRFRQNASPTVELDRRTGRLGGSVTVDGTAAGEVPLRIVPDDEFLSDRFDVERVTTDADGTLAEQTLPIGEYRVEATLADDDGAYEGTATTVTVRESGTARAAIDARFTWRLDGDRRDRIDRSRRDVRSVSEGGGRDGTIPQYYASVVESMLDVAESVPDAGHEFVGRDVDPADAVDGILAAADRTTDAISEAMTTKRNVDLFAACADMPDADVRWGGSFELAELLDRLEADAGAQRREVKQRYEAVDGLIEDRRGDLSEIAPAREMQQRAWELTREADGGPAAVAVGYTSLLLLDAVEELFEHDALRERLTRTVF